MRRGRDDKQHYLFGLFVVTSRFYPVIESHRGAGVEFVVPRGRRHALAYRAENVVRRGFLDPDVATYLSNQTGNTSLWMQRFL